MIPFRLVSPLLMATFLLGLTSLACFDALGDGTPAGSAVAATAAIATSAGPSIAPVVAPSKASGSGVTLGYVVPPKIAVGETIAVRLQFAGVTAIDGALVEVREVATRRQLLSMRLQQGEQRDVDFPFTARADGTQYLDVVTFQGGRRSVQSVPLRVGSGRVTLKGEGKLRTTPSGESVISMPASK
jgi:hypothetical protein